MAHYIGPKHKLARREGMNILDKTSASLQRRLGIPPGAHGKKRVKRLSEYGTQLREKQKAKATYGVMERQLNTLVKATENIAKSANKSKKAPIEAGEMLIAMLETRLDNLVYRLGFSQSRFQSRQFVSHGHILVNDKKVNIPSYQVQVDDVISLSSKMQKNPSVLKIIEEKKETLKFLDKKGALGKLLRVPKREDVDVQFNTQLIIEYYSR